MSAVVAAALIGLLWLVARAWRVRREPGTRTGAWLRVVVAVPLFVWFAFDQLVISSDRLADTAYRVYVVSTPDDVQGPLGLLAATELELDTELDMTAEDRDVTAREENARYEMTHRVLGVPVGSACVAERLVRVDGVEMRSYTIDAGTCT